VSAKPREGTGAAGRTAVRAATVDDASAVLAVHRTARGAAYAHLGTPEEAAGKATLENFRIQLQTAQAWVFERDGDVIGFAVLEGELLRELYVLPDARGTGAGKALLEVAVAHGARQLWVYEDNPAARAFYERHGWVAEPGSAYADPQWAIVEPAVRYRLGLQA